MASKKNVTEVTEEVVEVTEEVVEEEIFDEENEEPVEEESKFKKVLNKIKRPAKTIGLIAGGVILGKVLFGGKPADDYDLFDADEAADDGDDETE